METEFIAFQVGCPVRLRPLTGNDSETLVLLHAHWPDQQLYVMAGAFVNEPVFVGHPDGSGEYEIRNLQQVILGLHPEGPLCIVTYDDGQRGAFAISAHWLEVADHPTDEHGF